METGKGIDKLVDSGYPTFPYMVRALEARRHESLQRSTIWPVLPQPVSGRWNTSVTGLVQDDFTDKANKIDEIKKNAVSELCSFGTLRMAKTEQWASSWGHAQGHRRGFLVEQRPGNLEARARRVNGRVHRGFRGRSAEVGQHGEASEGRVGSSEVLIGAGSSLRTVEKACVGRKLQGRCGGFEGRSGEKLTKGNVNPDALGPMISMIEDEQLRGPLEVKHCTRRAHLLVGDGRRKLKTFNEATGSGNLI